MTFVSAFYTYSIEIVDTAHGRYETVRIKVPRHPAESAEFLQARVMAYAHSYAPGLEFTQGLFDPKAPTLIARDLIGETTRWIQVGAPEREKIQRALRHSKEAEFRVYFTEEEEIDRFCHFLRGSTTNWVEKVRFFLFDPAFLNTLAEQLISSSKWHLTFTDEALYATMNGFETETKILSIDIWARFQESIQNV